MGKDINVTWTVEGEEKNCKLEQNEDGFLIFNRLSPKGKKPSGGQVFGEDNVVKEKMKDYGDGTVSYTDALGWRNLSSPQHDGEWQAGISLSIELKCTSTDGTEVKKKFNIKHTQKITFP